MKLKISLGILALLLMFSCSNTKKEGVTNNENNGKIKVYLLGTFHFAQTDSTYNILADKHQKSIKKLNDIIVGLHPDKIFIERMPDFEYQNKMDSLYSAYRHSQTGTNNKNEIWQVAFKVGKRLGHQKLYQCDHSGRYGMLYTGMKKYAKEHNQMDILDQTTRGTIRTQTRKMNQDSLRNSISLLDYIKWLNRKEVQASSHAYYLTVPPQIGYKNVYEYKKNYLLGTELTADWYRRNIYIYSKMINQLDYNEESIFLIIGNDHIPIIRQMFEGNPYFKVMDTQQWLK